MNVLLRALKGLSRFFNWISCVALVSIMGLTVLDIILRRLRHPIDFTYEVVALLGAILIGFSIPQTTFEKGHVVITVLPEKLSPRWQKVLHLFTRCLGIALFGIIGWNIIAIGKNIYRLGRVSPNLQIPEYPVAYSLGICCFIVCFVLIYDLCQKLKKVKP